jgi:hypothetical protein
MVHGTMAFVASDHRLVSLRIDKSMPLLLERPESIKPSMRDDGIANKTIVESICSSGVRVVFRRVSHASEQ